MGNDQEILESAGYFVKRFGTEAPLEAAQRARELEGHGDAEGCRMWLAIEQATKKILANGDGIRRH